MIEFQILYVENSLFASYGINTFTSVIVNGSVHVSTILTTRLFCSFSWCSSQVPTDQGKEA